MNWYTLFLAQHPYGVVLAMICLFTVSIVVPLLTGSVPNFSDPQLGFETRGTEISRKLTTWENLMKATRASGPLQVNPRDLNLRRTTPSPSNLLSKSTPSPVKVWGNKGRTIGSSDLTSFSDFEVGRISSWPSNYNASQRLGATDRLAETLEREESSRTRGNNIHDEDDDFDDNDDHDHNHQHLGEDGFFCQGLSSAYSRVVVTPRAPSQSLFALDSLLAICQLHTVLMGGSVLHSLCQTVSPGQCCPPWSIPNYMALLRNRTSCFRITEEDVVWTETLLAECFESFTNGYLQPECEGTRRCSRAPQRCFQHNAVYNLFHYILSSNYKPGNTSLDSSLVFLPIARSSAALPYFHSLSLPHLASGNITVPAAEFGVKGALFDEYLIRDASLMIGGALVIVVCLWSYTLSLFLTICSLLAVTMSLTIAYFIYSVIFNINFFPFMNLLAVVIAIGIGADDAFIFCKIWRCTKKESSSSTINSLVNSTVKSSALSMSVTSLTTAAALFSNCVSPITAINCFSTFAGTAVLVNLGVMLSWLPACLVVAEKCSIQPLQFFPISGRPHLNAKLRSLRKHTNLVKTHIDRCLVLGVMRFRWVWLPLLGGVAVAAAYIVLYSPKLRLPDSKTFQLFEMSHPFEQYDSKYRDSFFFERQEKGEAPDGTTSKLPLRFVWGVLPADNGNYLDPTSRGDLFYDHDLDVASPEAQTWLLRFCQEIRFQPFYQPTMGPLLSNCFIESFKSWMMRRCKDPSGKVDLSPCCEASRFPFSRRVFSRCLPKAVAQLYATPGHLFQPGPAGVKFSKDKGNEIKAIVIEYDSNYTYSNSFVGMEEFVKVVDYWFKNQLATAPPGLRRGWFVSDLSFYDLQLALSQSTVLAIVLSLGVALFVVFFTTWNVLISLFTVLSISAIIFTTVATLVLLGWKLNILESVAVTTVIGLSVDFSLHYGVHYQLAGEDNRLPSALHALSRMSGPISMGALTTGASGAFMLLSSVLPYIQIGVLLTVMTCISWLYATVFLISLLTVAGPEHGYGQFSRPNPISWCRAPVPDKPSAIGLCSESTLSTSSGPADFFDLDSGRSRRSRKHRSQSPALPDDNIELELALHINSLQST